MQVGVISLVTAAWASLAAAQALHATAGSCTKERLDEDNGSLSLLQKQASPKQRQINDLGPAKEMQVNDLGPGNEVTLLGSEVGVLQTDNVLQKTDDVLHNKDIFIRLDKSHVRQPQPVLTNIDLSAPEYVTAMAQRDEVCVPRATGGESMTQSLDFHAQIVRGRVAAASKGVVFAGLVRNIGPGVVPLFATLRTIGQSFARYHIIILENDSPDNTRWRLSEQCQAGDAWCYLLHAPSLGHTTQSQGTASRVYHLTQLRQTLLEQVRQLVSSSVESWDYVLMFDGDMFQDGSKGFHPSTVDALLGLKMPDGKTYADHPLDLVCANQVANWPKAGRFRDTFALKNTSWHESQKRNDDPSLYFSGNQLMPVKSCFSALALYRTHAIFGNEQCNYTYVGEDVCEHVPFNYCLAQKGNDKVAIYPPMVVATNDEGTPEQHCESLLSLPKSALKFEKQQAPDSS